MALIKKLCNIAYTVLYRQTQGENVKQQTQEQIRKHIRSDVVDKTINPEKQNRHVLDSGGYVPGRSYLLKGIDAQELVNIYHATGEIRFAKSTGVWKNRETVTTDRDIGITINLITGEETVTNRFTIHYSKTGTHIVPNERR